MRISTLMSAGLHEDNIAARKHRDEISTVSAYNNNVASFSITELADSLSGVGKDIYRQMGKTVNILERMGERSKIAEDDSRKFGTATQTGTEFCKANGVASEFRRLVCH